MNARFIASPVLEVLDAPYCSNSSQGEYPSTAYRWWALSREKNAYLLLLYYYSFSKSRTKIQYGAGRKMMSVHLKMGILNLGEDKNAGHYWASHYWASHYWAIHYWASYSKASLL